LIVNDYEAELYVHAIAIEREAAQRYAELAGRMDGEGNFAVAALFRMLSALEAKHLDELMRRTAHLRLPPLDADYTWPEREAPETVARAPLPRGMAQTHALASALQAEKRARAFFEQAARVSTDPAVRLLAREMAAEEAEHAAMLERMLARTPERDPDWNRLLGYPGTDPV
jgi:rubrerythrin